MTELLERILRSAERYKLATQIEWPSDKEIERLAAEWIVEGYGDLEKDIQAVLREAREAAKYEDAVHFTWNGLMFTGKELRWAFELLEKEVG